MASHAAAHPNVEQQKKTYFKIFGALTVLTVLEIAWVYLPIGKVAVGLGLTIMACTKAVLVGAFYMHLVHETKWLKIVALLPVIAFFYAGVLMIEAKHPWRDQSKYIPEKARVLPKHEGGHEAAPVGEAGHGETSAPAAAHSEAPKAEEGHAAPAAEKGAEDADSFK
jgi:cytochrome c oxidase subunit IV